MASSKHPQPSPEPLVLALAVNGSEEFLIVEGGTPVQRARDIPNVRGPMREERLREVLADRFGMAVYAIDRSLEQARRHVHERIADAPFAYAAHAAPGSGTPFIERRDYATRAERVRHLLNILLSTADGISLTDALQELPPGAAERILKPLAVRGLVKVTNGRWIPRECMKVNLPLIPE